MLRVVEGVEMLCSFSFIPLDWRELTASLGRNFLLAVQYQCPRTVP
jgi:hypothetical protein